ncbi:MAG: hypothetical protein R3E74_15600 [Pseudomonadales bacterium]
MIRYQKGCWFTRALSAPICIILSLILATQVGPANAHKAKPNTINIDQADYLSEIPIVNSATRLNQPIIDVPASISIIDRELIEASGTTEISQLLNLHQGIYPITYQAINSALPIEAPHLRISGRLGNYG